MKTSEALIVALYAIAVAAYVYYIIRHDKHYRKADRMLCHLSDGYDDIQSQIFEIQNKITKPPTRKKKK